MITLVCIAKWNPDGYQAMIENAIDNVDKIITVVDDWPDDGIMDYRHEQVEYVCRPLSSDFAAQRNFACSLVKEGWILHLDTDENLSKTLWNNLPSIVKSKCDIVMIPRRNIMYMPDGIVDDMVGWPDLQPKLHRPGVMWEHPVHEWPKMDGHEVVTLPADREMCMIHSKDFILQDRINAFFDTIPYHHEVCAKLRVQSNKASGTANEQPKM